MVNAVKLFLTNIVTLHIHKYLYGNNNQNVYQLAKVNMIDQLLGDQSPIYVFQFVKTVVIPLVNTMPFFVTVQLKE